jgi:hypothetical protein
MRLRINVTGDEALKTYLRALGPEAVNSAKFVLKRVADETVPKVKAMTPVQPTDGGELKASVRAGRPTYQKRSGIVTASIVAGGMLVDEKGLGRVPSIYANVQEAGTWLTGRLAGIRIRHTIGSSPFMSQEVMKAAKTIPDRLMANIKARLNMLYMGMKL